MREEIHSSKFAMTPYLSTDLKERIVKWYFDDEMYMREIATLADCSVSLVSKVIINYCEYGQVIDPFRCRSGRPKQLDNEDMLYLEELAKASPSLFLDEAQAKLESVRGIKVSIC